MRDCLNVQQCLQIMLWSFYDTHRRDDAENRAPSTSNVSGIESLASSHANDTTVDPKTSRYATGDAGTGATAGSTVQAAPMMLNPRNDSELYEDDEFEVNEQAANDCHND